MMRSCYWVLIETESQMELGPKFKIMNKNNGKDIDALICLGATLHATFNFS